MVAVYVERYATKLTACWLMRVAVIVPSVAKHTEQRFQPTQASIRMNSVGRLAKIRLAFMNRRGLPVGASAEPAAQRWDG